VSRYLNLNPEFFVVYEDLLPRLRIPHSNGKAVSLIEKQVDVLRGQCSRLENRLSDLISVARQNEALHTQLHVLIQDIISAKSLDDIVTLTRTRSTELDTSPELDVNVGVSQGLDLTLDLDLDGEVEASQLDETTVHDALLARAELEDVNLDDTLPKETGVDALEGCTRQDDSDAGVLEAARQATTVDVCLDLELTEQDAGEDENSVMSMSDADMAAFNDLFESRQTICGMPKQSQLKALKCTESNDIGSAALVPLWHESAMGLVLISSKDESRFASGKGVMFLNQLGELLSRRLHSLSIDQHPAQEKPESAT